MGNDSVEAQAEVEHCGNIITEMLLPRPEHAHMTQIDAVFCITLLVLFSKL